MKKHKYPLSIAVFLLVVGGMTAFNFVHADDDEDEYDDGEGRVTTQVSTPVEKQKTETVTQTIVVSPARIVTENQLQTMSFPDRDRDGIIDSEDAHPDIAEIYIVQDSNFNGIVDTFESAK